MEDLKNLQAFVAKIQAEPGFDTQNFTAEFYSNRPSKVLNLTSPRDDVNVDCRLGKDGFEYRLKNPAYVKKISISCSGGAKRQNLKIEIIPMNGDPLNSVRTDCHADNPEVLFANVGAIVRGFRISLDSWGFLVKHLTVKKVVAEGYSLRDIEAIEKSITRVIEIDSEFRTEAASREAALTQGVKQLREAQKAHDEKVKADKQDLEGKLAENTSQIAADKKKAAVASEAEKKSHEELLDGLNQDIEDAKTELIDTKTAQEAVRTEIEGLKLKASDLVKVNENHAAMILNHQQKERDLDQKILEKTAEISQKTDRVTKLNEQLQTLSNDTSLFADDMIGLSKQGDRQVRVYLRFVIAPLLAVVAGIFGFSIWSSIELFDVFVSSPGLGIENLIALKAFNAILFAFVLTFIFKFLQSFVTSIREIHDRRLRLSEISILARDVSDSALHGEEVSDEERRKVRLEVRMKIIREYLSSTSRSRKIKMSKQEDLLKKVIEEPKEIIRVGAEAVPKLVEGVKEVVGQLKKDA